MTICLLSVLLKRIVVHMFSIFRHHVALDEPWIGLYATRENHISYFHFMDHNVAHYFRWDGGEPNYGDSDFCVRLHPPNFLMRTWDCNLTHSFVCEKSGSHGMCT